MNCRVLACIDTHSVRLQACVEPFCALTVPIPPEFGFLLPPLPVCDLSLPFLHLHCSRCLHFHCCFHLVGCWLWSELVAVDWCWIIDHRQHNCGFWFQEAEYRSILLLFCLLISFFLSCFTGFPSPMALLEISEPDCTTIDMAITIRADSISLCVKNR